MITEIRIGETHLRILKDIGYLYTKDEDEHLIKLIYEWGNDIWTNLIQYFLALWVSIQFYFIH